MKSGARRGSEARVEPAGVEDARRVERLFDVAVSEIELQGFKFIAERPMGRRRRIGSVLIERIEEVEVDD